MWSLERVEKYECSLLKRMERAVAQLNAIGEAVTPRVVGNIVHLPFDQLDDYPLVKARLQQILYEYHRNLEWQERQYKEEIIQRINRAVNDQLAQGKKVTKQAILKLINHTHYQVRKYPRVISLLDQL